MPDSPLAFFPPFIPRDCTGGAGKDWKPITDRGKKVGAGEFSAPVNAVVKRANAGQISFRLSILIERRVWPRFPGRRSSSFPTYSFLFRSESNCNKRLFRRSALWERWEVRAWLLRVRNGVCLFCEVLFVGAFATIYFTFWVFIYQILK